MAIIMTTRWVCLMLVLILMRLSKGQDSTSTTSIYEADNSIESTPESSSKKTLTFLKELRNITKNSGESLRLRCDVSGTVPAHSFEWYKNDAPLIEEKNRMKIKNKLNGNPQWSMLKFKTVEPLDTAFYECRASNGIDTIKSVAIITIELRKGGSNYRGNHQGYGEDEDEGLLPETYSDPDFPGFGGTVEFEGDQKPTDFGTGKFSNNGGQNNLQIPNLTPNERSGSCQPYVGSVCSKYVGQEYVFISQGVTQDHIEQKLNAALSVITKSPELTQSCSHYVMPSICLSTLPLCDRRTEKPRKICREECEMLEDQLCRKELALARQYPMLGAQFVLPVCDELPTIGSPEASTCVSIGISQVK